MEIDRSDRNDRYVILNLEMPVLSGTKYRQIQHEYGTENTNALRLDEVFSVPMLYLAILTPTQSGTKRLRITYLSGLDRYPGCLLGASQAGLALARGLLFVISRWLCFCMTGIVMVVWVSLHHRRRLRRGRGRR